MEISKLANSKLKYFILQKLFSANSIIFKKYYPLISNLFAMKEKHYKKLSVCFSISWKNKTPTFKSKSSMDNSFIYTISFLGFMKGIIEVIKHSNNLLKGNFSLKS